MQNVAQTPIKAKYAVICDEACTVAKVNGVLFVFYDDGRVEDFTIEMAPFTVVLADVQTCENQAMWDRINGGAAQIACQRVMQAA